MHGDCLKITSFFAGRLESGLLKSFCFVRGSMSGCDRARISALHNIVLQGFCRVPPSKSVRVMDFGFASRVAHGCAEKAQQGQGNFSHPRSIARAMAIDILSEFVNYSTLQK